MIKRLAALALAVLAGISLKGMEMPQPVEIPDGAYGIFQVPDLNVSLPVFFAYGTGQEIVDAENSGVIRDFGAGRLIGDHAGSEIGGGVWRVEKMNLDCSAFLITEQGTERYQCYMMVRCYCTGYAYVLDGQALFPHHATDIICASCANYDGSEVYLAFFKLVGRLP